MSEVPATAAVSSGPSRVFAMDGSRMTSVNPANLTPYNFRKPGFLVGGEMRKLEAVHQRFVQLLGARLATFLRLECTLKAGRVVTSSFAAFCGELPNPTHLTLFQVESLRGIGLVHFPLLLATAMADRLLGGKGQISSADRTLTEIETALVDDVIQLILEDWMKSWPGRPENAPAPQAIGHETSARFLQTAAPDTPFIVMEIELGMNENNGTFSVGIPFSMVEAEVRKMQQSGGQTAEKAPAKPRQWRSAHYAISVPIYAEWRVREMSVQEVLTLREGDLIQLPADLIEQTRLRLNNHEKFIGRAGVQNGCVAVQINEQISTE